MTPWLPLISALVISTVTLIGIRINNGTNRAAIAAANEREYHKWQRESVLRLSSEAVETAMHAQGDFTRLAYELTSETKATELLEAINGYGRKLGANAAALHMLDAPTIGITCLELRTALTTRTFVWSADRLNAARRELTDAGSRRVDPERLKDFQDRVASDEQTFSDGFKRIEQARDDLTRVASAELRRLGKSVTERQVGPMRARFLRARRIDG